MGNDIDSLSHTKWRCQYHVVFAPKYRHKRYAERLRQRWERYCEKFVNEMK